MNGVGGLEATVRETDGLVTPVLNDFYGNVLATITNGTAAWNPIRVGGYGPVNGYQPPALAPGLPLAETLVWRSRRADPTGFYCMGSRYYDSLSGRFLSPDPLGHDSSMDLYSFANGDPINLFDANGMCVSGSSFDAAPSAQTWFDRVVGNPMEDLKASQGGGDYVDAYNQTQAQMAQMYSFQDEPETAAEKWSALINAVPFVGGIKMWAEANTGKDLITGQWTDRSDWASFFGVAGNFVSGALLFEGVASEAAMQGRLASGIGMAEWEAGNIARWQTGVGNWDLAAVEGEVGMGTAAEEAFIGGCFVKGTLVAEADNFREIQDIKIGEQVW